MWGVGQKYQNGLITDDSSKLSPDMFEDNKRDTKKPTIDQQDHIQDRVHRRILEFFPPHRQGFGSGVFKSGYYRPNLRRVCLQMLMVLQKHATL